MKAPAIQFYVGDWKKEPSVQACGLAARGLWFEMLLLMHESAERGVLLVGPGRPMTDRQLARATGGTAAEVRRHLAELEAAGAFDRRAEDGAVCCRRMLRERGAGPAEARGPGWVYVLRRADGQVRAGASTSPEKLAHKHREKLKDPSVRVAAKHRVADVGAAEAGLRAAGLAGGWRAEPAAGPGALIADFAPAGEPSSPPASPPSSPPGGEPPSPPSSPPGSSSSSSSSSSPSGSIPPYPPEGVGAGDFRSVPADGTEDDPGPADDRGRRSRVSAGDDPGGGLGLHRPAADPLFARFWAAYPRKTHRRAAEAAFARLGVDEPLLARMLAAVGWQSRTPQWLKDGGDKIPHAGNWLDGRRWEDEPPARPPGAAPPDPDAIARRTRAAIERSNRPAPPMAGVKLPEAVA